MRKHLGSVSLSQRVFRIRIEVPSDFALHPICRCYRILASFYEYITPFITDFFTTPSGSGKVAEPSPTWDSPLIVISYEVAGEAWRSNRKSPYLSETSQCRPAFLTTVNLGVSEPSQIVCGAPNGAAGQTVLVATLGAKLYTSKGETLEIKKSKIRGEWSEGMICAADEPFFR